MKKLSGISLSILGLLMLSIISCNRSDEPTPTSGSALNNINVPDGFTFNTTEDIQVQLQIVGDGSAKFERAKFFIFLGDPDVSGVQIASGGVNDNGIYQTIISIPEILDSLYISSNITGMSLGMVAIEGNTINHQFNFSSKALLPTGSRSFDFTDIISDFENGLDDWAPYRDVSIFTSSESNTPLSAGPMGSTDSFIWGFDTKGGIRSFLAPAKFTGDMYGQYIAYHYYLGNTVAARPVQNNIADIRITDGTNVLAIDLSSTFQHEVNAGWQTIYCKLDETETSGSGWRIGSMSTWTTGSGSSTTPGTYASTTQIIQILQNVTGILIAPEYQNGYYSSNGPEFICLGKVGVVADVTTFPIIQQGQTMDDNDEDGVPNSTDDYPDDANKAYNNFSPGEGVYATLAYEDLWPQKGDYDFNDLVIDYNYNVITNASNKVVDVVGDFIVKASGAGFLNGFAVELPVSPSTISSITGQVLSGSTFTLASNGTEAGQTNSVIPLFDDAHTLFNTTGFINTVPSHAYYNPVSINLQISFNGSFDISALGTAPYNPFIVANQLREFEVHLAGMQNTNLVDLNLFGTGDDDSNTGQLKYYQTINNLPWAIHLPVNFDYPIESNSIETAYLKFVEWAESGGSQSPNWYMDEAGYRNSNYIYPTPD